MENKNTSAKPIICPKCGMKIGEWDGRSKIDQERGCRKCYKRIVYHVVKGVTEIKPWPNRETSSGMTFI